MRKGHDGEKKTGKKRGGKKEKIRMKIVATTSLPAVGRPNANRWNAARSRQNEFYLLVLSYMFRSNTIDSVEGYVVE